MLTRTTFASPAIELSVRMKDGRAGCAGSCWRIFASLASCAGRSCACTFSCSIWLASWALAACWVDRLRLHVGRIGPGGCDEKEPTRGQHQDDDNGSAERPDALRVMVSPPTWRVAVGVGLVGRWTRWRRTR